jgi:hypothetical protein
MRVNLEIQPGQETRGDKLTISEVLAEYLRAEKSRLAPKTHVRYTEVIALFTHSLNSYAANSLSQFERARFDKLFNAEGEQHREFSIFSAPSIFLKYLPGPVETTRPHGEQVLVPQTREQLELDIVDKGATVSNASHENVAQLAQ